MLGRDVLLDGADTQETPSHRPKDVVLQAGQRQIRKVA